MNWSHTIPNTVPSPWETRGNATTTQVESTVTDWGEAVTALLALGGIFSWVAVAAKILPELRQKQVQKFLADLLLETDRAWWVAGVLVTFFLVSSCFGFVEVSNVQGGGDAAVRTYRNCRVDPGFEENERLPVGSRTRHLYCIWPFGSTDVHIKAARLPSRWVTVRPWWRTATFSPVSVQVTGSFIRPLVLVAGGIPAFVNIGEGYLLQIFVGVPKVVGEKVEYDERMVYEKPFDGAAVLLGCVENDLQIPDRLRTAEGWKDVFAKHEAQLLPARGQDAVLETGYQVRAVLLKTDGKPFIATRPISVRPVWDVADMIQGLLIEIPKNQ